jgi:hypothetical protein
LAQSSELRARGGDHLRLGFGGRRAQTTFAKASVVEGQFERGEREIGRKGEIGSLGKNRFNKLIKDKMT